MKKIIKTVDKDFPAIIFGCEFCGAEPKIQLLKIRGYIIIAHSPLMSLVLKPQGLREQQLILHIVLFAEKELTGVHMKNWEL